MNTPLTIDVHLDPAALAAALREDAARGLSSVPKELSPKWFYDERGSALFEAITHLPEYYPTRRERGVLAARAAEVAHLSGADTLVELGSGASDKTLLLLDALRHAGTLHRVVPLDVSESTLRRSCETLAARYPGVHVHGVVGDFERHLDRLPGGGRRLIAFLGGTIGNLPPAPRARFLASVAAGMHPGDAVLLGTDLVKDPARLCAAYDDAAGVTAAFNRNVLAVLNRELGADFVLSSFAHVAVWNPAAEWIEMRLRSLVDQVVTLPGIGRRVHFAAGEEMRTEISAKFRRERVETELATAGLRVLRWWTDHDGDFAVSLSVPA